MSLFTGSGSATGAAYQGTPEISIPFAPRRITLINMDPAKIAIVSFDGSADHVTLPMTGQAVVLKHTQAKTVFIRAVSGTPTISITAES